MLISYYGQMRHLVLILQVAFILYRPALSSSSTVDNEYFYSSSDYSMTSSSIIEYIPEPTDDENYNNERPDFLYNAKGSHHRVVEFYAHWCPHCQHYKSEYDTFAQSVQQMGWDDKVEVYAVSCVPNKHICREQNIDSYPTIRLYSAGSLEYTTTHYVDIPMIMNTFGIHQKEVVVESTKNNDEDEILKNTDLDKKNFRGKVFIKRRK